MPISPRTKNTLTCNDRRSIIADLRQSLAQRAETSDCGQSNDRQDDARNRHQQSLNGVGDAHCPEAAEDRIDEYDRRTDQDRILLRQTEYGFEGLARGFELRSDVKSEAKDDDQRGNAQNELAPLADRCRCNYFTQGDRLLIGRKFLEPRCNPCPVDQEATDSGWKNPQRRNAPRVRGTADAEQRPS